MPPRSRSPASDEEIRIANRLMDMVDNGKASTLSLDSAAAILTPRGLSLQQLHNLWPLADRGNKGHLTSSELIVAVRLIGWVQAGHEVAEELVKTSGPLPMLRGITDSVPRRLPVPAISPLMRRVSMITPKQQTIEKVFEFNHNETFWNVFLQESSVDGLLCREQILELFISRFSISHHYLAQIFELIDFSKRDALDIEEFCLGMHILEAFDSSSRLVLPPTIPPDIYDQLMHLESLISKAATPSANVGTGRSASIDHQQAPSRIISGQPGTHNSTSERTASLSTEGRASLTTEIEEDMKLVRDDLVQMGRISGDLMTKFRLRYRIYPIEMARIWNSIPGYDAVPLSRETIESVIKCIRTKLTESLTACAHSPVPSTPASRFLFESDTKSVPDFASLPHRVASPASSEYSSCTDTASSVPEVKPFIVSPIDEDEEWPHTDSSSASSCRWSRRPPASYAGSYSSSVAAAPRKAKPNPPPPNYLRRSSGVPAGNQYFSEEIKSLREQLQEVQHRLHSGTMSSDKQSRLQQHYTEEIDRLTSALAQKDLQCEASRALLGELQDSATKLTEDRDDLQKVVEAQTEEISGLTTQLTQAKHDIKELASTSTSPNMRILFLRASLRESRSEVDRMKEDAEKLQEIVAAQKAEICQLNTAISRQPSVVESVQEAPQNPADDALGSLGSQVQGIHNLMQHLIRCLDVDKKSAMAALANHSEKQHGPRLRPATHKDHDMVYDETTPVLKIKDEPEHIAPELDWGNVATTWRNSLAQDAFTEMTSPTPSEGQKYGILTPPDTPEGRHSARPYNEHAPVDWTASESPQVGFSSPINEKKIVPLKVAKTKTAHPTPSSLSDSSLSGSPPYKANPVYSGFDELRKSKDLHLRAAKSSRLSPIVNADEVSNTALTSSPIQIEMISKTTQDAAYLALSPKTLESSLSSSSRPPDYVVDSASFSNEMIDSKSLYFKAKGISNLTQAALSSPLTGLDERTGKKSDGVPADFSTQDRGVQSGQGPQSEESVPEPQPLNPSRPIPSRRSSGPKRDRLQEWYEQEIGRLMGRCVNAQKLAEKAKNEEEHPCLLACQYQDAAINAMDDAHNLRDIVHWQRNKIVELNDRLEGRFNLVVNNPDDLADAINSGHGPVDLSAEELLRWTPDPPSYEQASDYEMFHSRYPVEKGQGDSV